MGFMINHNVTALGALGSLNNTTHQIGKSLQKLSTGLRIVQAGDDASGLAISETFRAQINALQTNKLNAQDGISMLQPAEGALNEVQSILQRINTLAVRSANDATILDSQRTVMNNEVTGLKAEIDRIAADVTFNTKALLNGSISGATLQVGPGATANDVMTVSIGTVTSAGLALTSLDISTASGATAAITSIVSALASVSSIRGDIGVVQNRLQHTLTNLDISIENTTASESAIRDVDMAAEISNFTRLQILQQANVSMLGQANSQPQSVLKLLS